MQDTDIIKRMAEIEGLEVIGQAHGGSPEWPLKLCVKKKAGVTYSRKHEPLADDCCYYNPLARSEAGRLITTYLNDGWILYGPVSDEVDPNYLWTNGGVRAQDPKLERCTCLAIIEGARHE